MIAAVAAAYAAEAAPAHIAPALNRPYRLTTEEVRLVAGKPYYFVTEHRLMFSRDGGDLVVQFTLDRLRTDAPAVLARLFRLEKGSVKGRPIRAHLTDAGKVRAVEDEVSVWATMLDGFRAMTPPPSAARDGTPISRDPAGTLAKLPADARLHMITSALDDLCVDPATLPGAGTRPVRVVSRPELGVPAELTGAETTQRTDAGMVRTTTRASNPQTELTRIRVVDPSTGLLVNEEEQATLKIGQASTTMRTSRLLVLLVS